jgi:hypothetical protein
MNEIIAKTQLKYLGETILPQKDTPYKKYNKASLATYFAFRYGQIDGSHHKQWVIDQMVRILFGTPVIFSLAKWDDGQEEWRLKTGKPSQKYLDFVRDAKSDDCSYDEGIAP